tara:strand:- start:388 stop:822 length:435 start_codon:yes stop_codon:yes gene_type:complete
MNYPDKGPSMDDGFEYFAFVDNETNIVKNVICCSSLEKFQELQVAMGQIPTSEGRWIPANERTRKPSKGNHYSVEKGVFYPKSLYKSWILNEKTMYWDPPVPKPKEEVDPETGVLVLQWLWDETNKEWISQTCANCDPPNKDEL